ncbi:MAG: DNA primase [Gemmatimonadetes bacterium]|nr:MAG: DNA primase [Gemmatimonadota bacterium]
MAKIPSTLIDQIRAQSDIVEVIGQYVTLKKAGRNYKGLCPFHTEKTPSFTVSPDKEMFYCFGCNTGGNVFSFLMQHEKIGFTDAAKILAERAGITIPSEVWQDKRPRDDMEALHEANAFAARFYHHQLVETATGLKAREYLGKTRGFNEHTWEIFQLGYAPESWDILLKNAQKAGFSIPILEKAGLIKKSEKGTYYDAFRGRIMFPIMHSNGRVIGFGGRILTGEGPKYINTPETPVYSKRQSLYGLAQSKSAIAGSKQVILVEGYADVISLYQAGVTNVAAPLGTAFTAEQARILRRLADQCVLLFDSDVAGENATQRGIDILLAAGLEVRVARILDGKDPDEFVRKYHKKGIDTLLTNAKNVLDYMVEHADTRSAEAKARSIEQILHTLAQIPDEIRISLYLSQLSSHFDIAKEKLMSAIRAKDKTIRRQLLASHRRTSQPRAASIPPAELKLLALMLTNAELFDQTFEHLYLDDFSSPQVKRVIELVYKYQDWSAPEIDLHTILNEEANPHLNSFLSKLILQQQQIVDPEKTYIDCIQQIKIRRINRDLAELRQQMSHCTDEHQLAQLNADYKALNLKKQEIRQTIIS